MSKGEPSTSLGALQIRAVIVVKLVSEGLTKREIEKRLGIVGGAVSIFQKLDVKSREKAVIAWGRLQADLARKLKTAVRHESQRSIVPGGRSTLPRLQWA